MRNKKKINILVDSNFNENYRNFLELYFKLENIYTYSDLAKGEYSRIDLLLFTGGADVNPRKYGEVIGKHTHVSNKLDDECEALYYNVPYDTLKVGICRGSQFLTVMSGGELIQHVEGHTQDHVMDTIDSIAITVTSTHHQMLYPFTADSHEMIGWSDKYLSSTYLNGNDEERSLPDKFLEPEIVYYEKTNSLAIQGHPEFERANSSYKNYVLKLINRKLKK